MHAAPVIYLGQPSVVKIARVVSNCVHEINLFFFMIRKFSYRYVNH